MLKQRLAGKGKASTMNVFAEARDLPGTHCVPCILAALNTNRPCSITAQSAGLPAWHDRRQQDEEATQCAVSVQAMPL